MNNTILFKWVPTSYVHVNVQKYVFLNHDKSSVKHDDCSTNRLFTTMITLFSTRGRWESFRLLTVKASERESIHGDIRKHKEKTPRQGDLRLLGYSTETLHQVLMMRSEAVSLEASKTPRFYRVLPINMKHHWDSELANSFEDIIYR